MKKPFYKLFDTKLKKAIWVLLLAIGTLLLLVLGFHLLFYTEFENGYLKVILRSHTTLNQNHYCIKENRQLSQDELIERATKDFLKKLYDKAHSPRYYSVMQEEWYDDFNRVCSYRNEERKRNSPHCQFWSNGKQININDVVKMIDFNKTRAENVENLKQHLSIQRPFEEEQILTDNAELKYSLFFDNKGTFYFIPYNITFINAGGYLESVFPSKFGYSNLALGVKWYYVGDTGGESYKKFNKDDEKRLKEGGEKKYYFYYPITNCGEVEIRTDDDFKLIDK